ncbi:hypothetical protein [Rhizobacter sp. LjRoot28]|jgi:hypothetical protein|uniref:hypothetical protein n=1 Tax=Rhizobacter sp. LjRoot28 TaxID=3342309 RepID=UPI003ED04187
MAQSSILGGQRAPTQASGRDTDALGPSDSTDSGSDVQGERPHQAADDANIGALPADLGSDTDSAGTGERGAAFGDDALEGADILPDRIDANPDDAADLDVEDLGDVALDDTEEDLDEAADESTSR